MSWPVVDCPAMKTKKHTPTAVGTSSGLPSGRRCSARAARKESREAVPPVTVRVSHWWNSPTSSASSS